MVANQEAGGAGPRYGVASMWSPLRRVLVRRPATAGDFAGAGWRRPDPGLLIAQHEAFCELLAALAARSRSPPRSMGWLTPLTSGIRGWSPSAAAWCSRWPSRGDGGPTCLAQPLLRAG